MQLAQATLVVTQLKRKRQTEGNQFCQCDRAGYRIF